MKDADQQIIALLNQIKALSGGGGGGTAWGAITGTLSSQTDLNTALGTKQTAAQVQAFVATKGVVGRAYFDPRSGSISDPDLLGAVTAVSWQSEGVYAVSLTSPVTTSDYAIVSQADEDNPLEIRITEKSAGGFTIRSFIPSSSLVTGVISYTPTDTKRITVFIIN